MRTEISEMTGLTGHTGTVGAAPELNWAGNYRYTAAAIHRPRTLEEVQEVVAGASKIRALGSRHSFNAIADSPGSLISLEDLDPGIRIDPAARTVTVSGGTRYGTLAEKLESNGYGLPNLASLPHISVAGAIATATHGSGDANGNLATSVAALEIVAADGTVHRLGRGSSPDFDGAVVGLGALGVVTKVTLDIEPTSRCGRTSLKRFPGRRCWRISTPPPPAPTASACLRTGAATPSPRPGSRAAFPARPAARLPSKRRTPEAPSSAARGPPSPGIRCPESRPRTALNSSVSPALVRAPGALPDGLYAEQRR